MFCCEYRMNGILKSLKIILLLFMALIELIFHKGKINNTKQIAWWEMYIPTIIQWRSKGAKFNWIFIYLFYFLNEGHQGLLSFLGRVGLQSIFFFFQNIIHTKFMSSLITEKSCGLLIGVDIFEFDKSWNKFNTIQ
jgi:hypothetical protein